METKEVFIDFIPLDMKTAETIIPEVINKLGCDGLNLKDCRGQSYDNQATMAGVHSGFQKQILDLNPLAVFTACNNHSFTLVDIHAGHLNVQALTFFFLVL
jgi:hypothetical protein